MVDEWVNATTTITGSLSGNAMDYLYVCRHKHWNWGQNPMSLIWTYRWIGRWYPRVHEPLYSWWRRRATFAPIGWFSIFCYPAYFNGAFSGIVHFGLRFMFSNLCFLCLWADWTFIWCVILLDYDWWSFLMAWMMTKVSWISILLSF